MPGKFKVLKSDGLAGQERRNITGTIVKGYKQLAKEFVY